MFFLSFSEAVSRLTRSMKGPRKGRSKETSNPLEVQKSLVNAYEAANSIREQSLLRTGEVSAGK